MKPVLNEAEAAKALGLSQSTLRAWRRQKRGPSYLQLGRAIRYRREDIEAYGVTIDQHVSEAERHPTKSLPADGRVDLTLNIDDPRNYEAAVRDRLIAEGFEVHRNGWPDFLAVHTDGRVKAVEVKAATDIIPAHQVRIHEALRAAGIEVEVVRVARDRATAA